MLIRTDPDPKYCSKIIFNFFFQIYNIILDLDLNQAKIPDLGGISLCWSERIRIQNTALKLFLIFFFQIDNIILDPDLNWAKILDPEP